MFFVCLLTLAGPDTLFARTQQGVGNHNVPHHSDTTEARQLIEKAQSYFKQEQYQASVECLHRAETLTKPLHITRMCIMICRNMFAAYQELGKLDSALIYADMLLGDARKIRDPEAEMDAWNFKAILYNANLELDSAMNSYKKAHQLAITLNDKVAQAIYSSNMGIIFGQQRQYEKAYTYFREAYMIGREIGDSSMIALGAMNIGRGLAEEEKFDSAKFYLVKAERAAYAVREEDPGLYNGVLSFQALLNLHQGNYERAETQYQQLAEIYSQNDQSIYLAEVYGYLAEINYAQKNYLNAINYGLLDLNLIKDIPAQEIREKALLVLTKAYGELRNYKEAFYYGEQYRQIRDSSYGAEVTRLVAEVESKYELDQKNSENYQLSMEAQQQKSLARQRTIIALVTSLITLLILGILFFFNLEYRHKKQLNRQLEATVKDRTAELESTNIQLKKSIEELRTFGHITSHDLKEPLRNISGFSSLLERRLDYKLDDDSREFLHYIKQNTHQMHELIEDILAYSTLDDQPFINQPVDLQEMVNKAKDNLSTLIQERNGSVQYDSMPVITNNEAQVFMVLKNLIENGLKYNRSEQPEVYLRYDRIDDKHHLYVSDNGIGIPAEYQDQIFQLFKRLHNRSEFSGTGMGLAISKKIAQRLGGELIVRSNGKKGSTFIVVLPVNVPVA